MNLEETSTTAPHANGTEEINTFYFYATGQLAVLWTLFLMIVLGNSAVLLALAFSKNRKSRMNYFIMQLAIADLAVGLISVLTDIVWRITISWHAGNLACKFIRYLQNVSIKNRAAPEFWISAARTISFLVLLCTPGCLNGVELHETVLVTYSSTYVLVALSIDRYDAIKHPMKFTGSWRRAKMLVAIAWILSAVFSLPILVLYEEKLVQGHLQCWIELAEPWQWQVYMTVVSVVLFLIPALIISACYAVIVSTIWSKSGRLIMIKPNNGFVNEKVRMDQDTRRASSRGLIPRAKVKTIKMTFVIVFVFIVCWSPYFIFDLLQVYGYVPTTQTNIAVASFVQSLAPLNSAANPLIYCLFSTRICRGIRKLPPFSWLINRCCPNFGQDSCLGYSGGDFSSTLTSSVTAGHSIRRSPGSHLSRTSLRRSGHHHVTLL